MAFSDIQKVGLGAGLGVGGGLLANKLFGGGDGSSPIDVGPLLNTIRNSAARQKEIASTLPGRLNPLGTQYKSDIASTLQGAQTEEQAAAQKFLQESGKAVDSQGQQLSDILKQRVLGATPELTQNLRESLAGTGGLERGGANLAFQNLAQEQAGQIGQGEAQIALQQNENRQKNLQTVLGLDENFIQNKLGINKDTLTALYNSGRQDLIDEANSLLGIEDTQGQRELGVQEFALTGQMAQEQADKAKQQALMNALLRLGGTAIGAYAGGPAGAAVGSQVGGVVADSGERNA